jgi:branched-chain amino acid transport system substrate-binding protein
MSTKATIGRRGLLAIAIAFALLIAACGSGADDDVSEAGSDADTETTAPADEADDSEDEPGEDAQDEATAEPIVIGFTSDSSGQYANSGAMDRRGMMMAIKEFNERGGVLGRPIEYIHFDTETNPATGTRVAQRLIEQEDVAFMIGAVSSGVANAISQVAQENGVIYLNTNSSSPSESSDSCHLTKFVWDGHGGNFAKATVLGAVDSFGPEWLLLTNDYVWGHETSAATRALAEENGVTIVDELLVPQGTRDFSTFLLTIQQTDPDVVAAAVGGDDLNALRTQVVEQGMDETVGWINNQQDWPDVYGAPPFGVFGTTWYYDLDLPGVDEFVAKYQEEYPDTSLEVPGNVYYNGYMATRTLLEAIEQAGTTNNHEIIKLLEGWEWTAEERMQDHGAWIDPDTHHVQQTIYLGTANSDPSEDADIYEILTEISPDEAMDAGECNLESFEDTPVYEP